MVQGQVFLKGGLTLFLFKFSRFIIFTFRNYLTLCKIVLCTCEENFFFLSPYNFMKKVILSCRKINLKISHKLR